MKKIITFFILLASAIGIQAQNTWVVAGAKALTEENWNPTSEANKMTSTDEAIYTLVKEGCKLKANTSYHYKFVKNGEEWYGNDEAAPTEDAPNYELKVTEDGTYTITFTFNATTLLGSATAIKTGDAVFGTDTWTLAGVTALFGTSWNIEGTNNDMVTGADGKTFTLTKEGLVLVAGVSYQYKVVQNHEWDVSYGTEGGPNGNAELIVEETATYTVVFTFVNDDSHLLTAVATKTGEAQIEEKIWTIAGVEAVLGSGWNNVDTANDMIKQADNTYVLVKTNVKLINGYNYEFKVLSNHSWDENYGMNGVAGGSNYIISVDKDGIYDITFTWNYENRDMSITFDKIGDYTVSTWTVVGDEALCGSFWDYSDAKNDMTTVDNVNYVLVKKGLKLETDTDYKFIIAAEHSSNVHFGSPTEFAVTLSVEENGEYTVTFKFNVETKEVSFETEKTVISPVENNKWTIAGVTPIMGSYWDQTDTNNDMTYEETDGLYKLAKAEITLSAGVTYEYKVVKNHSWDENYGMNGVRDGLNCSFTVPETGCYDLTFIFNAETKELSCTVEKSKIEVIAWPSTTVSPTEGTAERLSSINITFNIEGVLSLSTNATLKPWLAYDSDIYYGDIALGEDGKSVVLTFPDYYPDGMYTLVIPQGLIFINGVSLNLRSFTYDLKKPESEKNYYTCTFINGAQWEKVYAFTFNPEQNGAWPGREIAKTSTKTINEVEYDVYTFRIEAATKPNFIIFNNGEGAQTADLTYIEGHEYDVTVPGATTNYWEKATITPAAESTLERTDQFVINFGDDASISLPYNNKYIYLSANGYDGFCYTTISEDGKSVIITPADLGEIPNGDIYLIIPKNMIFINGDGLSYQQFHYVLSKSDGDTSSIENVSYKKLPTSMFNLQGQRVQKNYRGLVIQNGKKVMVK